MKKIAFAAQVFGTLAMFPLLVALEINHGTAEACKHAHEMKGHAAFSVTGVHHAASGNGVCEEQHSLVISNTTPTTRGLF